jgi:hypothetical protein
LRKPASLASPASPASIASPASLASFASPASLALFDTWLLWAFGDSVKGGGAGGRGVGQGNLDHRC